jgi:hypothetical protein
MGINLSLQGAIDACQGLAKDLNWRMYKNADVNQKKQRVKFFFKEQVEGKPAEFEIELQAISEGKTKLEIEGSAKDADVKDKVAAFTSRIEGLNPAAASEPVFKVRATYDGGHPEFQDKQDGELRLYPERLEFAANKNNFAIQIGDIIGCELKNMHMGGWRTMLGSDNRAVQTQTTVAQVQCNVKGLPYEVRFDVHALTVTGAAENARKFRDALYRFQPSFARPAAPAASPATAAPPADGDDIPARLRQLATLKEEGVLTKEEFAAKKAELLSRL